MLKNNPIAETERLKARARLRAAGVTVREFAATNGLSERVVFNVLGGRSTGNYGQSHKAAVLLGLKEERAL